MHGLPRHVSTLSQRVRFRRSRIDDHRGKRVLTLQRNNTVRILSKIQDGVDVSLRTTSGDHGSVISVGLGSTSIRPSLHKRGEDVANVFASTDFIFPRGQNTVVLHILEVRKVTNVSFAVGMANRHKGGVHVFGVEPRSGLHNVGQEASLLVLQLAGNTALQTKGQRRINFSAGSTVGVFNVRTSKENTDADVLNGFSSLFTDQLRSLFHNRGVVRVEQNVGHRHEPTVLIQRSRNISGGQSLSRRRNTFGQLRGSSIQRFIATELNGLRVLIRDGISLTELFKHEIRKRTSEHLAHDVRITHVSQIGSSSVSHDLFLSNKRAVIEFVW
nr:MAG TPA: hypothetical protein [Caudoviricetes sp.]